MGELVENVIDNHWMVECKDGMNSERVRRAKAVLAYFGPDRLVSDAFSEKSITDYRKALVAKGNANATVNLHLAAIKTMLPTALKKGVLGARPDIVMMPKVKKKKYVITKDEEKLYLETCLKMGEIDLHDLVLCWRDTGSRRLEPVKTSWADWTDKAVTYGEEGVVIKNGGFQTLPLTSRLREMGFQYRKPSGGLDG